MKGASAQSRKLVATELILLLCISAAIFAAFSILGAPKPPRIAAPPPPAFSQTTQDRILMTRFADDRLVVRTALRELPHPITDPTDAKTIYRYQSTGFARPKGEVADQLPIRFIVYAEDQPGVSDAARVCRFMLRLWDMLSSRLGMDHPLAYERMVYVFLKKGGKPGAEQKITTGSGERGEELKRNSIFIYDIASLADPMEFCRELAHEYGHAVLPAVGGLKEPEYWTNGVAGEYLFLSWLAKEMAAGQIKSSEVFDVPQSVVQAWVVKNVDSRAEAVFNRGFDPSALKGDGEPALDAYIGLLLATDALYGDKLLARGMLLANGATLSDVYSGIGAAIAEKESLTIAAPLAGQPFWAYLPGAKWKLTGGTTEASNAGWIRIKPVAGAKLVATHPQ